MAEIAENQVLWNSLKHQAMAMHPSHGHLGQLSPAAAVLLRQRYTATGGGFVGSMSEVPQQFRDRIQEDIDRKKAEALKEQKALYG